MNDQSDETVVETFTPGYKDLISTVVLGDATERSLLVTSEVGVARTVVGRGRYREISSGSVSDAGCRKIVITNKAHTLLGRTAYHYVTSTQYCWNRAKKMVYYVDNEWHIEKVDPYQKWEGEVNSETFWYDHGVNDGFRYSAYKHWRQGHFSNEIPVYGTWRQSYPTNLIRAYYDGTFKWATQG